MKNINFQLTRTWRFVVTLFAVLALNVGQMWGDTWTVAGSSADILNSENTWAPTDEANDLTNVSGNYWALEISNKTLNASSYAFKICLNHAWTTAYPGSDYSFSTPTGSGYTLLYTFNSSSHDIHAYAFKSWTVAGSESALGSNWGTSDENNLMTRTNAYTYTLVKKNVALVSGTIYECKAVKDKAWGEEYPDENKKFSVDASGNYDITFTLNLAEQTVDVATALVTYDITLDKNGGSADGSAKVTSSSTTLSEISAPTRTNYHVEGYYTNAACTTKVATAAGALQASTAYTDANGKWTGSAAVSLFANWEGDSWTITYKDKGNVDYSGSNAALLPATYTYGTGIAALTDGVKAGYTFDGWYENADCDGDPVTSISSSATGAKTLYAKFTELVGGSVTLTAGVGGEVSKDNENWGASATITDITAAQVVNIYARPSDGYTFDTWTITAGTGSIKTNAAAGEYNAVAYSAEALTASFTENKVELVPTVSYDHGSSVYTATSANAVGIATTTVLTASAPNEAHYAFAGWTLTNLTVTDGNAATDRTITVKVTTPDSPIAAVAKYNEVLTTTWTMKGDFADVWQTIYYFLKPTGESTGNVAYTTLNLSGNKTYEFKVIAGGTDWKGNAGTMTIDNCTDWEFTSDEGSNCHLTTTVTGQYTFKIDFSDEAKPKLSVVYPIGAPAVVISTFSEVSYAVNTTQLFLSGYVTDDGLGGAVATKLDSVGFVINGKKYPMTCKDGEDKAYFWGFITDLEPGTTYSVKAFADNSAGQALSEAAEFTTRAASTCIIKVQTGVDEPSPKIYAFSGDDVCCGKRVENAIWPGVSMGEPVIIGQKHKWYAYELSNEYNMFVICQGETPEATVATQTNAITNTFANNCFWYWPEGPTQQERWDVMACPYTTPQLMIGHEPGNTDNMDYYEMAAEAGKLTKTVALLANSSYKFKPVYGAEWYGKTALTTLTRAAATATALEADDGTDLWIETDFAGDYKFTFDPSTQSVTVTYPEAYILAWDANGGDELTGTYTNGLTQPGTAIVKPNDPTRADDGTTGYLFKGWAESASGAVVEIPAAMPSANKTYYAQWDEIEYCYKFAPTRTNGSIEANAEVETSVGGKMVFTPASGNSPTLKYSGNGIEFGGASQCIVTVTLDNLMKEGTILEAVLYNHDGSKARGVKLQTADGTQKAAWTATLVGDHSHTYTVTAGDGLDGTNVLRLARNDNSYLKSLKVYNCGAEARFVTYNTDGSTSGNEVVAVYADGSDVTVKDNEGLLLREDGKVFAGWATTANATAVEYLPGATISAIDADVDLYPVWKRGYYFISLSGAGVEGTRNDNDFLTGQNLTTTAPAVNGVIFSKSYFKFGGTPNKGDVEQNFEGNTVGSRFLAYDIKTTETNIYVYIKNTVETAIPFYYRLVEEGEAKEVQTINIPGSAEQVVAIPTITSTKNARVLFGAGTRNGDDYNKLSITQIKTIETGTDLLKAGEVGYELAIPGRFVTASKAGKIDGLEVVTNADVKVISGSSYIQVTGESGVECTQYVKFTNSEPVQLQIATPTDNNHFTFYVKDSKTFTEGEDTKYGARNTLIKANVKTAGTWYILGDLCANKIAFAAAPVVTYDSNGGTGTMEPTQFMVAENGFTAPEGYHFAGWKADETAYAVGAEVLENVTLKAQWEINKFTVTIAAGENGSVDKTSVAEVPYGTTVVKNGNKLTIGETEITATPADQTAEYTYAFAEWSDAPETITGAVTITAKFSATKRSYTIKFMNGEQEMQSSTVEYGVLPTYTGETPTKAATAEYTYTFNAWDPAIVVVTGDATYNATFTETKNKYTITIVNDSVGYGAVSATEVAEVPYGTPVVIENETPNILSIGELATITATPASETDKYKYEFKAWVGAPEQVTGDVTIHVGFIRTDKSPATAIGNAETETKAVKFIRDNKIFIRVNGMIFDASGRRVE